MRGGGTELILSVPTPGNILKIGNQKCGTRGTKFPSFPRVPRISRFRPTYMYMHISQFS